MMRAGLLSRLARPLLRPLFKPRRTATTAGPGTTNGAQPLRSTPSKEEMLVKVLVNTDDDKVRPRHPYSRTRVAGPLVSGCFWHAWLTARPIG